MRSQQATRIVSIVLMLALLVSVMPAAALAHVTEPFDRPSQRKSVVAAQERPLLQARAIPCPMNLPEGDVDGETVVCGQVTVPENWDDPGERTIDITYAILRATSSAPFADPIIYLEGGPGGSALEDMERLSGYFAKLRETRDFIMYDQRGTAYSGNLECPAEVQAAPIAGAMEAAAGARASSGEGGADSPGPDQEPASEDAQVPLPPPNDDLGTALSGHYINRDPEEVLEEARATEVPTESACRDYFAGQGVDLTQYTTAASIQDLIALMDELGHDVYNVYGISYGSRLGLELLRAYAEAGEGAELPEIRSVVIDGIDPPHVDTITQSPFARMLITLRTLSECEAEEDCGAAYPDIRQRAVDLVAQVREAPLQVTNSDGMVATVPLAGLTGLLTGASVSESEDLKPLDYEVVIPYLPRLVDELSRGVGDTYVALKQGLLPPAPEGLAVVGRNPFDPLALRTRQLSQKADELARELAILAAQAQRAGDALASNEPLPVFFVRELVQLVGEQSSFEALGAFGRLFLLLLAAEEPNRDTLRSIIDLFDVSEASQATLQGIMNLMSDEEVAEAVRLTLTDNVIEQLTQAVQGQMNTAVLCNDTYGGLDLVPAFEAYRRAEAPALISGAELVATYIARCERYGLTTSAGESTGPVVSDLPVLVVNGGIDATTPAEWGESTAGFLPNAQLVTVPMYGHGASAKSACGQDIVRYFFTYPDQVVNASCTEDLKPSFVLPDDALGTAPGDVDLSALDVTPSEVDATSAMTETVPMSATQVITFSPQEVPEETRGGTCFTSAPGLQRGDAWRCITEDNEIYDPCFEVEGQVVCGADPVTGEAGFALQLSEPLPDPNLGQRAQPWLVELEDGRVCQLLTGTAPVVDDERADYGCDDGTYLLGELEEGDVWMAANTVIELTDGQFVVRSTEPVFVQTVWR